MKWVAKVSYGSRKTFLLFLMHLLETVGLEKDILYRFILLENMIPEIFVLKIFK